MIYKVTVPILLVPGSTSFLAIAISDVHLTRYGWPRVTIDSGPAGKITVEETRTVTYYLEGKTGATAAIAESDVRDALAGAGLLDRVRGRVVGTISQLPAELAHRVGEQLGAAVGGVGEGLGIGGVGLLAGIGVWSVVAIAVAVGVLVVAAKRG